MGTARQQRYGAASRYVRGRTKQRATGSYQNMAGRVRVELLRHGAFRINAYSATQFSYGEGDHKELSIYLLHRRTRVLPKNIRGKFGQTLRNIRCAWIFRGRVLFSPR